MPDIKKPRGTVDILPEEMPAWRLIERICREKADLFGFSEIRFPTFESTELFVRGVGDTTDVVQKEMYTFTDKDDRSLTLRPEGTACVCRSVVENGLYAGALPLKLFYLTNFFRYEKPQAGRTREFFQFGCESFGADTPYADAEAIMLGASVINELGISFDLQINSIGCTSCRPAYREALKKHFESHKDELCDTCRGRLETNPLRILDCKSPICRAIAEEAPKTTDFLCDDCRTKYETLKGLLKEAGIKYTENPKCVRGLDYYTGIVFEYISTSIGAQAALGGGGRYNGLIAELGGPEMPAIGFGMGLSRLALAMQSEGKVTAKANVPDLYMASLGDKAAYTAFVLAAELRTKGVAVETDIIGRSAKAQMKYADKRNAVSVIVIGDSELENGEAVIKNLADGTTAPVRLSTDAILAALGK